VKTKQKHQKEQRLRERRGATTTKNEPEVGVE
jgi:hypothetical protein